MFRDRVSNTPMTSQAANEYFANKIVGQDWNSDDTFLATLRALLAHRLAEEDTLTLVFTKSGYSADQLESLSAGHAVKAICDGFIDNFSTMHIHNFYSSDDESNSAWMKAMETQFCSQYEGWHCVDKATVFFRKVFHILCFINPEKKSVVIFTDNMDTRRMHYLQCGIPAFLPWYLDPQNGVTELEMELIKSLREKEKTKYLDCLAKIAEQYDFQTARIRKLLRDFETSYERTRCDQMKNELSSIIRNLNSLDAQIAEYLQRKADTETTLLGLELKISQAGEDSEIMDYFLTNRHLILKDVRGSSMEFVVRAPLDYFDEDMARRYINNDGSYFYEYITRTGVFTRENIKMLMSEIFLTQRLKVQFCTAYRFKLEGSVESLADYGGYDQECREYMPNPHIDRYNCMGNYKRIINERLREHDYIGALEQCIASCKSLNIGDSPVMHEFVSRFCEQSGRGKNIRCIVMPDGRIMTPREAIDWLNDEKAAQEAAAQEAQAAENQEENREVV